MVSSQTTDPAHDTTGNPRMTPVSFVKNTEKEILLWRTVDCDMASHWHLYVIWHVHGGKLHLHENVCIHPIRTLPTRSHFKNRNSFCDFMLASLHGVAIPKPFMKRTCSYGTKFSLADKGGRFKTKELLPLKVHPFTVKYEVMLTNIYGNKRIKFSTIIDLILKVVIWVNTKTWINRQNLTYLPEIWQTSYFLLFSTVYNAKWKDMLFKKVF